MLPHCLFFTIVCSFHASAHCFILTVVFFNHGVKIGLHFRLHRLFKGNTLFCFCTYYLIIVSTLLHFENDTPFRFQLFRCCGFIFRILQFQVYSCFSAFCPCSSCLSCFTAVENFLIKQHLNYWFPSNKFTFFDRCLIKHDFWSFDQTTHAKSMHEHTI